MCYFQVMLIQVISLSDDAHFHKMSKTKISESQRTEDAEMDKNSVQVIYTTAAVLLLLNLL